jgi:hypothetical protein
MSASTARKAGAVSVGAVLRTAHSRMYAIGLCIMFGAYVVSTSLR